MGYYTAYNINYKVPEGEDREKFSQKLALGLYAANSDFYYAENYTIEEMIESEMMKWYDYEEDMCKLSKLFPSVLFTLEGFGEERDDMWREYFFNGKCQYAPGRVVYEEFDENKLR